MDHIKEAFQKVKQDISALVKELNFLKSSLIETKEKLVEISDLIKKKHDKTNQSPSLTQTAVQTPSINTSTHNLLFSAHPTHSSTHNYPLEPLKPQNIGISTGNQGASTDRQTDRQTNRHTPISNGSTENSMENALDILNSLDNIRKEIRLKFKRLTEQEFLVFSAIYQLDEELGYSDYKLLSQRLNLTESSIRDYIGRLIKKGISVEKTKINNKYIQLNISEKLKKIASLPTILQLKDL